MTVEPESAKSGRARTLPVSAWLQEVLEELAAAGRCVRATTHVFGHRDGSAFDNWDVRKRLRASVAACAAIPDDKKPKVTMHTLRHTAASLMVAAGVPIFDVAKVLGHGSVLVTMRYAHFAPEAGRAAIEALERTLRPDVTADRVGEALHALPRRTSARSNPRSGRAERRHVASGQSSGQ